MAGSLARINTVHRMLATVRKDLMQANFTHQVLAIRSQARVIRALAREVKDRTLEMEAAEVRFRAERRLGQMIGAERAGGRLSKGTAGMGRPRKGGSRKDPPNQLPTLADILGDKHKHIAHEVRALAKWSDKDFENLVAEWRENIKSNNQRVTSKLLRRHIQTELDPTADRLTSSGRKLEDTLRVNAHAPIEQKLGVGERIIEVVIEGIRTLEKLAARIGEPTGIENFQKEFRKMEERVVQLTNEYWATKGWLLEAECADRFDVSPRELIRSAKASLAERGEPPTKANIDRAVLDEKEYMAALRRLQQED